MKARYSSTSTEQENYLRSITSPCIFASCEIPSMRCKLSDLPHTVKLTFLACQRQMAHCLSEQKKENKYDLLNKTMQTIFGLPRSSDDITQYIQSSFGNYQLFYVPNLGRYSIYKINEFKQRLLKFGALRPMLFPRERGAEQLQSTMFTLPFIA